MQMQTQNKKVKGVKVPALRFPEFSGEWEEKSLGDLCLIKTGKKDVNEGNPNGKYPFFTCARTNTYSNKYSFDGDAILIAGNGEVGNCQFYSGKFEAYQRTYVLQNFSVEVKYLFLYLGHSFQTLASKQKQMGAMPYIKLGMLTYFHVCLPVAEEQQKIAEFLGAVDEKIEQLSKKKSSIERYKKGVMQKIFSQEIRFKDENGNSYPDWEEKKLGEVAEITTGSSNREDSTESGKYVFFDRSMDVRSSSIFLFDSEAIIIAGEGLDFKPRYFSGKFDLHQRAYAIMKKSSDVDWKFLFYSIFSTRHYFSRMAVGSTMPSLRLPVFKKMLVDLPYFSEQQKIADFLTSLDEKISAISSEIVHTKDFKKGLLQQMFV